MTLNNKQQVFVSEYLKCWNASEAARRAGYNGQANIVGPRLLSNVIIAEEIKQRLAEIKMSADEVLTRLADMARADISDFVTFVDGIKSPFIDLNKAREAGKLHLVKKIKYNAQGQLEFELHDPIPSLLHIGKVHGLFADKLEVSGKLELGPELDKALKTGWGSPPEDKLSPQGDSKAYADYSDG